MYQIIELDNKKNMYITNEISEEEFKKLKKYNDSIRKFKGKIHSFELLQEEYAEYFSIVKNKKSDSTKIIRAINNYLSSYKGFLDKTKAYIKRNESEQILKYLEILIKETYENSFEYRFIYNLRNYSQHVGNPISRISSAVDKRREILINKQVFINSHSGMQSNFKKELNKLEEEEIDINNAIGIVQMDLLNIQEKLLNRIIESTDGILHTANFIKKFYEEHSEHRELLAIDSQENINSMVKMSKQSGTANINFYIIEYSWAMRILESSKIVFKLKGRIFGKTRGFPKLIETKNILEIPKLYTGSNQVKFDGIVWVKLMENIDFRYEKGYDKLISLYMPIGLSNKVYQKNIKSFD